MSSNRRASFWLSLLVSAGSAALLVLGGCALDKNNKKGLIPRIGGHGGEVMEPKRCLLKVAIISRPFDDPAVNDVVWRVADEQIVPPAERHVWEVNGLRVGRIIGELPLELDEIMRETTAPKKVDPVSYYVESGEQTLVSVSEQVDKASVILNREGRVFGKDYDTASGFFRVTVRHEAEQAVGLRLTPEIHYGPIQRAFQAAPNANPLTPQQFQISDGQAEETLRDLAVNLVVESGQVVVIGCRPEQKRGLGTFMLTQAQAHSDQRMQRLILIWASRNLTGVGDPAAPKASDRPRFERLRFGKSAAATTGPGLTPAPRIKGTPAPQITSDPAIPTAPPLGSAPPAADASKPAPGS